MTPVILSGGVGSRLSPLSSETHPKQFLNLVDPELSMLQQTVQRASGVPEMQPPMIVCNEDHRFMVGEQLQQIGIKGASILLEPEGRNTAPAIALAAFLIAQDTPEELMLIMPADHVIEDTDRFVSVVSNAVELAKRGELVTFGIVATSPETGYGYIKSGEAYAGGAYKVTAFKEKPDVQMAQTYLDSGDYFWNGGIFLFSAASYLEQLKLYAPEVYRATERAVSGAQRDLDFIRVDESEFRASPSISVDYAVMEKTEKASVMRLDAGWNDVGSWSALWDVSAKDEHGNALQGDVIVSQTSNSYVYSETKLVSALGVKDLVIVETDDAVMVAHQDQAQNVKDFVQQVMTQERSQLKHHRKVYRPWGWYDSIDVGERFQVKRIQVKPGAKLSVQMHHHRAEHWVVVKGTAEVLNGETVSLLTESQSIYIPIGAKHSLRNPSDSQLLEIIEVQLGSYLGEDDIVRFEDNYGRV